ncbi:MAG TPA: lipoyl(octanoyl) transferase LipB [Bacteroidota bacterium]
MENLPHSRLQVAWLGRTEYRRCWALQQRLCELRRAGSVPDTLLLTEHDPVFTIGRTGDPRHVLAEAEELRRRGIELVACDRGGDVTYHGPGQLVAYPILDLHGFYLDLHRYLRALEGSVITLLSRYGIRADRHPSYTGVWVGDEKICAIGIRSSRWITMHGLALNVNTDLTPFDRIIPCGIFEKGVTSMERLLGRPLPLEAIGAEFAQVFASEFDVRPSPALPECTETV